jgi:Rod binding domain-containing protein
LNVKEEALKTQLPLQNIDRQTSNKVETSKFIPSSVKKIAQDYEAQFAELMLQEMKKTVEQGELDTGSEFYQSLLQKEQANSLTQNNGGLGIQKMILNQIYPERWRTKEQLEAFEKASSPKKQTSITSAHPELETKINLNSKNIELKKPESTNE